MNEFLNRTLQLYCKGRWKEILNLNQKSNNIYALKLLWVWPSEENLKFIKGTLKKLKCEGITSIGCGCGLLEWIINESCGIAVQGFEVNKEWWDSKYSNPQFITLKYFDTPLDSTCLNPNYALMFCYFNDKMAFQEYIKYYSGNVVIIIGPGKNAGRHTDPLPFEPEFGQDCWQLFNYEEVNQSKDFIAVYVKT